MLAILPSPAVRASLEAAQDALRQQGRGTFPPPEALHLTLAFLGETEDLSGATAALAAVRAGPSPCPWAALRAASTTCGGLASRQTGPWRTWLCPSSQTSVARGFYLEDRPFRPHITLVRRWQGDISGVTVPHAKMVVRRVSLLRSALQGERRVYTELAYKDLR